MNYYCQLYTLNPNFMNIGVQNEVLQAIYMMVASVCKMWLKEERVKNCLEFNKVHTKHVWNKMPNYMLYKILKMSLKLTNILPQSE
jgi:hypothetical protein